MCDQQGTTPSRHCTGILTFLSIAANISPSSRQKYTCPTQGDQDETQILRALDPPCQISHSTPHHIPGWHPQERVEQLCILKPWKEDPEGNRSAARLEKFGTFGMSWGEDIVKYNSTVPAKHQIPKIDNLYFAHFWGSYNTRNCLSRCAEAKVTFALKKDSENNHNAVHREFPDGKW